MGGCRTEGSTNLLLMDVIELYPDLLLGRRWFMMRNEDGRWRKGEILNVKLQGR